MNEKLTEDLLDLVTRPKPVLFSDVIASLRGGMMRPLDLESKRRWKNIREDEIEDTLEELGVEFRYRRHGAGLATYVWSAPFDEVETRYGMKPVFDKYESRGVHYQIV